MSTSKNPDSWLTRIASFAASGRVRSDLDVSGRGCEPLSIGSLRTARQHAEALMAYLINAGYEGKALPVHDLEQLHISMCEELGWCPRHWTAIGRELDRLGVPRARVAMDDGSKPTFYEVVPVGNVVAMGRRTGTGQR